MTGGAGAGYIDAGCGPDDIVAALNEGSFDTESTGLGGIGRAGCAARGGGAAAGPMPGPIALASCLQKKIKSQFSFKAWWQYVRSETLGAVNGCNLFVEVDVGGVLVERAGLRRGVAVPNDLFPLLPSLALFLLFPLPPLLVCLRTENIHASSCEVLERGNDIRPAL